MLADPTVSRRHAELVPTEDSRFYLADCGSKFGTHVRKGNAWRSIRQMFIGEQDEIRLGQYETTASELIALMRPASEYKPAQTVANTDHLRHARQTQFVARSPSPRTDSRTATAGQPDEPGADEPVGRAVKTVR